MRLKNKILICLIAASLVSFSQTDEVYTGQNPNIPKENKKEKKKSDFKLKDKLIYGGNFSVWLGTQTVVNITPTLGYKLTKQLNVGAGLIYNYSSIQYYGKRYEQSLYGTHTFARFLITDNLFLQAQYDRLNQPNYLKSLSGKERIWLDYYLIGGGFRQSMSKSVSIVTSILYNLSPHELSVYNNPYFQFGIVVGL